MHNLSLKIKCVKPKKTIFYHIECGPVFVNGEDDIGPDMCVSDMSNQNKESYSDYGNCYQHPLLQYRKEKKLKIYGWKLYFSN